MANMTDKIIINKSTKKLIMIRKDHQTLIKQPKKNNIKNRPFKANPTYKKSKYPT